jgi:hypothetical protein
MSASGDEALRDLTAFAELLALLEREAIQYAVIGGCAVGVYARLRGERVLSMDLDIYAAPATLNLLIGRARDLGLQIQKGLEARTVPVAVFEWRGMEINVLTASRGLPEPDAVIRDAREVQLDDMGALLVPVADPFDLLKNKLAIRRDKDLPHIELLTRFVQEEVVHEFGQDGSARKRMSAASRLLGTLGVETLPEGLVARLIPLADTPPLRRFIVSRAPSSMSLEPLLERVPEDERTELAALALATRKFFRGGES